MTSNMNLNMPKNIPKPTELKISTMTCLCLLNVDINLDILSRFIRVYPKDDPIITTGKGGIVYVEYFLLLPRGQYCGKKAQIKKKELQNNDKLRKTMDTYDAETLGDSNFKEPDPTKSKKRKKKIVKKRQFENQATLIFHFNNGRYVNIKVFHNGKIQMTGVRSKEEAFWIVERLIEIIKETKVSVIKFNDVKEDPSWAVKNQYIYTTPNDNNNNNNNNVKRLIMINDILTWVDQEDEDVKDLTIGTLAINDLNKIKMSNFEIVMINSNYSLGFNIDRTKLHLILKRKYNIYATLESTYQAVKSYYFFSNNQTQTQTQNPDETKETTETTQAITNIENNIENNTQNNNGVCKCEVPCFVIKEQQKGITPPCSQVTIAVFRTGSVIITGGCTIEQTMVAYKFINQVVKDNYSLIFQESVQTTIDANSTDNNGNNTSTNTGNPGNTVDTNNPIYKLKQLMIDRANENKRRAKKNDLQSTTLTPVTANALETNIQKNETTKKTSKRGCKPKIIVAANEIINSPYMEA